MTKRKSRIVSNEFIKDYGTKLGVENYLLSLKVIPYELPIFDYETSIFLPYLQIDS